MSFLARLDRWVSELISPSSTLAMEKGNSNRDLASFLTIGQQAGGLYPSAWTDSRIEQVRHFKAWVYVAITKIAEKIAQQIPNVSYIRNPHKKDDKKSRWKWLQERQRRKALTPLQAHENLENVHDDHPLVRLLKDPNEPDTAYDLWYETILFLLLTGSAYWWIPRLGKTNIPAAIHVIPSHWVWPIVGKDKLLAGYEVRPIEGNFLRKELPPEEVIHIKRKNPISKIDGCSPLSAVARWVDTAESIDTSRWWSFKNGAFPGLALELDAKYLDPADEDLLRIEAKFMQRMSGEVRTNKPMFLPPGVKLSHLTINPNEMAYVESFDQIRDSILSAFGVPSVIAMVLKDMTYGSILAAQAGFTAFTINPLLAFLGQVITEKLAWLFDNDLRVWWEDTTPDDPTLVESQYATDAKFAAITPNELRAERGRESYKMGGDDPLVQGAMVLLPLNSGGNPQPLTPVAHTPPRPTTED